VTIKVIIFYIVIISNATFRILYSYAAVFETISTDTERRAVSLR